MKIQFLILPIGDSDPATHELNAFFSTHHVAHIERQFVADGTISL